MTGRLLVLWGAVGCTSPTTETTTSPSSALPSASAPTTSMASADTTSTAGSVPEGLLQQVTDGYACDPPHYVAHDAARSVRVIAALADPSASQGALGWYATTDAPEALLFIDEGSCLLTPGCTDVVAVECEQVVTSSWRATAGEVSFQVTPAGLEAVATDVVFESVSYEVGDTGGVMGENTVTIDEVFLPARAFAR